jgi:tRNA pseudouridine38-40 synthase
LGQVANFKTSTRIPPRGIMLGLNSVLPRDIVIKDVFEVPEGFDSRRDAKGKTYVYRVLNRPVRSPLLMGGTWLVTEPLDVGVMKRGGRLFTGRKDFTSFRAAGSAAPHSVREIFSFTVEEKGDGLIEFEVRGTAFLRHMVRIMVGTIVELGRGRLSLEEVSAVIDARDRTRAPQTASPEGLFLKEVEY